MGAVNRHVKGRERNRGAKASTVYEDRLLSAHTPESRGYTGRTWQVMTLTARLNALAFEDENARKALLKEIFARPLPRSLTILPPFYCDFGLNTVFGEQVFINQGCFLLDVGGVTIGDRVMIGPRVTISTAGHPTPLEERYSGITYAPIVIEEDVWIGAGSTITQGVTIGRGSVVGAGTVVAEDVPALSVVTGTNYVERRRLGPES